MAPLLVTLTLKVTFAVRNLFKYHTSGFEKCCAYYQRYL